MDNLEKEELKMLIKEAIIIALDERKNRPKKIEKMPITRPILPEELGRSPHCY